ncbi:MAG: pyridoxal-phosphate-dependent aminotransferase family protein [Candidatus Binatia bacterium]
MATGEKPTLPEFHPPRRILLGPGPSPVDDRVTRAMTAPVLGHLDPLFLKCMDDIQVLLRYVFETQNRLTIPVSGTGSAGMEATVASLLEPGDEIVVCVNGYFGERMCEMVTRLGAKCIRVDAEWGKAMDIDKVRAAWNGSKARAIFAVQAETSTGVLQPIAPLRKIADERDGLLLIDAVTSLGAHEVAVDKNGIDACYSGTQKGLSCPPGLSPVTFSERALKKIKERKTKPSSWYLDVGLVANYWNSERTYHHTAPITMNYALREALRIIVEEGLEARRRRHELNHRALVAGVEAMGLKMHVDPDSRLWTLNTVRVSDGVDDARVRKNLLEEFNIEIGGGLGVLKGRVWRVGLMGGGSTANNVLLFLAALEKCLAAEGFKSHGSGVGAAETVYLKRE